MIMPQPFTTKQPYKKRSDLKIVIVSTAAIALVIVLGTVGAIHLSFHNSTNLPTTNASSYQPVQSQLTQPPTHAQPQSVEQAFPNAKELSLNEAYTDGALSYKLISVRPNYSDVKYNHEISSANPYSGQDIPGADATPTIFTLATVQFTNISGRTACENVLTICPDGGSKFDFGCIYTSDNISANLNSPGGAESNFVFHPDFLIGTTTYPNTSLEDKGSVIRNGGTYNVTVELSSDCTALGNATGTVYWKLSQ